MFYTVTFNPAVDLFIQADEIKLGQLNRINQETFIPGGKGINISVLLKNLGVESVATGFIGGFTGDYIESSLKDWGIASHFIDLGQPSRVNIKLNDGRETEINGPGPQVSPDYFDQLTRYFKDHLRPADLVFLSGNIAPGMTKDHYQTMADLVKKAGSQLVVDTNTDLLTASLAYQPFLIKPNIHELGDIFAVQLKTGAEALPYAKKLQELGARHILLSMGSDGALLLKEDGQVLRAQSPQGQVVNPSGAGDSMLAGFIASLWDEKDYRQALAFATACGAATAFSSGIASQALVQSLVDQITIQE
ncbi:1-phosphofructokinase [Alloiococcus otitis]|uniref:1-phosphofructokinase n=1 Tax=Alloiococcus otitis TaxID=1652 RepID=UPI00235673F3|nr:1-phosphofructokinase [Alloiococcus otitis]